MKRNFLLFSIITCITLMLVHCTKESETKEIHWTTYTTSDGLINNNVDAIAIDKEDNLWFAADAGVSKFDGNIWTNYTMDVEAGFTVTATIIAIDAQDIKWIGGIHHGFFNSTHGLGISKFDGNTWTTYTMSDGLAGSEVHGIAFDKEGNKWFGTGNGVSKFDGSTWTTYIPQSIGLSGTGAGVIVIDAQGNKWIGTEGLVSKFDGVTWIGYSPSDGPCNEVLAIGIDKEGNKWVGTKYGVSKFDNNTWTNYTTSDGLICDTVTAIAIDKEGNKWFGTANGISKFDGNNWTNYTTLDGLIDNGIRDIEIDAQGNKWFCTGNGVSKLSD